jgi:hypothetical protein
VRRLLFWARESLDIDTAVAPMEGNGSSGKMPLL